MKFLIGLFSVALLVFVGKASAQQLEVEGRKYTFRDVVYESFLDTTDKLSAPRVVNPFDHKTIKIYVAPEGNRTARFNDAVWWVPSIQVRVGVPNRLDRFYNLETVMVAPQKTEYGTVSLELHKTHYGKHPPAMLHYIFDTFIDAIERTRKTPHKPQCLELSGKLYLSNVIQKASIKDIGQARVNFIFDPQDAAVVECPK